MLNQKQAWCPLSRAAGLTLLFSGGKWREIRHKGGSEKKREVLPCKLERLQGKALPVAKTLGIAFPKVRVCKFFLSQHFSHWEVMGTQPSSLSHGEHEIG